MKGIMQGAMRLMVGLALAAVLAQPAVNYVLGSGVTTLPAVRQVVARTGQVAGYDFGQVRVRYGGQLLEWIPGFAEVYGMHLFFTKTILISGDIPLDAAHSQFNLIVSHELWHVYQEAQESSVTLSLRYAAAGLTTSYQQISYEREAYRFADMYCLFYGCQLAVQ